MKKLVVFTFTLALSTMARACQGPTSPITLSKDTQDQPSPILPWHEDWARAAALAEEARLARALAETTSTAATVVAMALTTMPLVSPTIPTQAGQDDFSSMVATLGAFRLQRQPSLPRLNSGGLTRQPSLERAPSSEDKN